MTYLAIKGPETSDKGQIPTFSITFPSTSFQEVDVTLLGGGGVLYFVVCTNQSYHFFDVAPNGIFVGNPSVNDFQRKTTWKFVLNKTIVRIPLFYLTSIILKTEAFLLSFVHF